MEAVSDPFRLRGSNDFRGYIMMRVLMLQGASYVTVKVKNLRYIVAEIK